MTYDSKTIQPVIRELIAQKKNNLDIEQELLPVYRGRVNLLSLIRYIRRISQ